MDRSAHPRRPGVTSLARQTPRPALLILCLLFVVSCGEVSAEASVPPPGALVVSFIDVGQGDATLVQSGGESYLVDGGDPEGGPEVVDFLRSRGVGEFDGMVATHPDADHIGGLPDVLAAFEVSKIYLSGDTKATTTSNTLLRTVQDEVQNEGAEVLQARAGLGLDWGRLEATVVAPSPEELSPD